jgi:hypothetical protein
MAIVQDSYNIPDEIMMKISTGENKRFGGVVRNNKGQIVKHLKPVNRKNGDGNEYRWVINYLQLDKGVSFHKYVIFS